MKKACYVLLATLLYMGACSQEKNIVREEVRLDAGIIAGSQDANSGIIAFKGIPFAAPPLGELRWRAPQPVVPWEGVLECKKFGPSPMQAKPRPFMYWSEEFLIPEEPISEDCLNLNVWTGAKRVDDMLPVLVYIYGGGFRSGGGGCAIYDGAAMAKKGVVFVSINYRVGTFGFLSHPELSDETEYGSSGNYGILDMIAGLEWVKRNISKFGGDPDKVTIAGQSAGAFGVNYLTVSPLAQGLFHRAIAQSGASFVSSPLRPDLNLEAAEELGNSFAENLQASNLAGLRALPADSIQNARGGISSPIVDGYVIPAGVKESYKLAKQNHVPVLLGWNKDDRILPRTQPADAFRERIKMRFGDQADDFFAVYPCTTQQEAEQSQLDMSREEAFGIQMYVWAKMQTETGTSRAWIYNFNRNLPAHTPETAFGAFHSGEIVYAYDNLHTLDRPWEDKDQYIADLMSSYWVNFATNGDPNGPGLPIWKAYDLQEEQAMIFDTLCEQQSLPNLDQLGFWARYYGF